jgi:hypothetical protein
VGSTDTDSRERTHVRRLQVPPHTVRGLCRIHASCSRPLNLTILSLSPQLDQAVFDNTYEFLDGNQY